MAKPSRTLYWVGGWCSPTHWTIALPTYSGGTVWDFHPFPEITGKRLIVGKL